MLSVPQIASRFEQHELPVWTESQELRRFIAGYRGAATVILKLGDDSQVECVQGRGWHGAHDRGSAATAPAVGFEAQIVNPAMAEVILIHESLEAAQRKVAESHAFGIDAYHAATITVDGVFTAPDLKAVQVLIVPTEGDLQCLMELSDSAIGPRRTFDAKSAVLMMRRSAMRPAANRLAL